MYLKDRQSGDLVEILDVPSLTDPFKAQVSGRFHSGEEMQDPHLFAKDELGFPSGESLPRCWREPEYQRH